MGAGSSTAFGEFSKSIFRETGQQFIVVTYDPRLAEMADKVYRVEQENGVSKVVEMG